MKRKMVFLAMVGMIFAAGTGCGGNTNQETSETIVNAENNDTTAEYHWPTSAAAGLLPVPESDSGEVFWDDETGLALDVFNISRQQYDAYVDQCVEKGFTDGQSEGDADYSASNENGYLLNLSYDEKAKMMYISLAIPEAAE